jgi:hypothetical protein
LPIRPKPQPPNVKIIWKQPSCRDRDAARKLIERIHYRDGVISGEFVTAFANFEEVKLLKPEFEAKWVCDELCLVGAAILKQGITYSNPKGRRDLADRRFPGVNFNRLTRDEIVRRMGLALISRVAVEPQLQGIGVGRSLATECRKQAPKLVPDSRYVEVMTSQRLNDAQRLQKEGSQSDFLQAAGFRLAPIFTRIQKPRRDGRNRRLYCWAPVIDRE